MYRLKSLYSFLEAVNVQVYLYRYNIYYQKNGEKENLLFLFGKVPRGVQTANKKIMATGRYNPWV